MRLLLLYLCGLAQRVPWLSIRRIGIQALVEEVVVVLLDLLAECCIHEAKVNRGHEANRVHAVRGAL